MDHRTTMRTNNYRNYIAKLDISQKAFDGMLAVDLGMFGSLQRNNYLPFLQKLLYSAATFNPTFPDGPNADGTYPGVPEAMWITNPVAMLQMKQDEDNAHFNVHLNALLTLAPNLKLRAFGSYSYNTVNNSHYYPTFVWSHGEAYRGNDKTQEMLGNVSLDYTLNTGPSSLNVMVLAEAQERKVTGFHTTVTNFSRDDLPYGHSAFRGSNYGHVTTSVADFVLAKLALNAEIYADDDWTDQQHLDGSTLKFQVGDDIVNAWEAAIHYCDRFNAEGFQLADEYADNFTVYNESSPENIWVIPMDRDLYKT